MENEIHMEEQILEVDKLYEEGEYAECKRRLLDMLDQEPGFGRAHHLLGCLYFYVLDDHEKAARHMRLAVKFAPGYPAAFVNYARLLNYRNRHMELLELVAEALEVEGVSKCMILMEKGKSFELNGNRKEALRCYYEAERFAIHCQEVEAVRLGIKRLKRKQLRPLKRLFWLPLK
jgi:tetratricopeptide (TPR) repeat protein